jgi:hypothetical protein
MTDLAHLRPTLTKETLDLSDLFQFRILRNSRARCWKPSISSPQLGLADEQLCRSPLVCFGSRRSRQVLPGFDGKFRVEDLDELRAILEPDGSADPELDWLYFLKQQDVDAINSRFAVGFTPELLGLSEIEICICRWHEYDPAPYLIHTGYELPLLLDGVKKLSKFSDGYPPMTLPIDGMEDRFDRWVQEGKLHKEVVIEPFEDKVKYRFEGLRTVYYTLHGEEWRIPAMKLLWSAATAAGGWNEHFERLEGLLFGYEDWQNDWWIAQGMERGRYAGRVLCCAVNAEGLNWLDAAGFRALPPA